MSLESDLPEEPKDRTLWMWLGVLALVAVMAGALWFVYQRDADVTQVRAKHILIKFDAGDPADRSRALETITDLRKRILEGESFAKLAKDYSNDEFSSARGGDLGYYRRGVFEAPFEECVWTAPIGELSDVIQTAHGFHLIIVGDRTVSKADQYERELERKAAE